MFELMYDGSKNENKHMQNYRIIDYQVFMSKITKYFCENPH